MESTELPAGGLNSSMWLDFNSQTHAFYSSNPRPEKRDAVDVVGLGTPIFASIHGTAIASLVISIFASIAVLLLMLGKGSSNSTEERHFRKLPIGRAQLPSWWINILILKIILPNFDGTNKEQNFICISRRAFGGLPGHWRPALLPDSLDWPCPHSGPRW